MNSFVVTLLLAFFAQSNPSQTKPTEQPCTGPTLVGTWELVKVAGEATPAGGSHQSVTLLRTVEVSMSHRFCSDTRE